MWRSSAPWPSAAAGSGRRSKTHGAKARIVDILINGQTQHVADGASVEQMLAHLGLAGKFVAVEVNLQLVPRPRHAEHRLATGDRVEIVTLVGGG